MRARFWGVRGSIPAPGPRTVRYGGNTPCVELEVAGETFIIDAGTGIRELGFDLMRRAAGAPIKGRLFIGHTHWDHIQGFPFFTPLFLPTTKFDVYGMRGTTKSFQDVMAGQMHSTYFPLQLQDLGAKPEFHELNGPLQAGPVKVTTHFLNHPGITVGYRFEHEGKVLSYISDHEPYGALNPKGQFSDKEDAAIARFVAGSDLLVLDLLMPRMHGFEVCQRLRADPELKGTKILISSSKSYQHDVRTAVEETGADGYIVKPFDVNEFNRRVDEMAGGS